MIGYDLTEEPTLVAQKINNPFNILGVYIGFYLMKLGFGYAALLIPIILATISFYLISNFSFNVSRLLRFEILLLILVSVLLGFVSNVSYLSEFKEVQNFEHSGLLGGLIFSLIYDWTGFYGSVLILFSSIALFLHLDIKSLRAPAFALFLFLSASIMSFSICFSIIFLFH